MMNPIIVGAFFGWLASGGSEEPKPRRRRDDKEFHGHHLPGPCG